MENLYRAEDNTALRFFSKAVKNNFRSEKEGRMVFDTGLYVEVITPGSTESVPEFLCELTLADGAGGKRTAYYDRYKKQIEAYKEQNGEYAVNGTPIGSWAQIDVGTAATLRACGIQTVEDLASVSDTNLHNLGTGGRTLREQAKAFITGREFGIPTAQMGAEVSNLRDQLQALQAENAALRSELGAARAAPAQIAPPPPAETLGSLEAAAGSLTGFDALGAAPEPPPAAAPALVI